MQREDPVRVFREEDPMDSGYTVISNDTLWVDLSCRALGLLTRWLSKPPGVEIDTIQDMVTRSKRRGNKRMEGRDALYTASYELEEEGFLVRRLFTNEKGQHEWAAFVRSRPVPPEERSNPAERKRDTVKPRRSTSAPAKPAAKTPRQPSRKPRARGPVPGNPFSGLTSNDAESSQVSPVTGFPDSGDPDSENQASSYQSSLHSSLSSEAADQQQAGAGDGTREKAPQKDDKTKRTPLDAVVEAYVMAHTNTVGMPPRPHTIRKIREDAAGLLAAGRNAEHLEGLAADLALKGWDDLVKHLAKNPEPGRTAAAAAAAKPWCGQCPPPGHVDHRWIVPDDEDQPAKKCSCFSAKAMATA
ncbi:hypothetical protein PV409_37905 [Streptomyces sp. ME02-6979.5a]|uniref:hypothetical protein n=1 Tax=unclassified Streptomyces TaxID=2593676 RepID=UPI0029A14EEB|nr:MULTISPECIES: hypothetical protein [unclassified Streptomyces]MDX3343729.1 hypothetical protein [Streptomyces sp. ME02-6979.5a]MDX5526197.1 hypothetical protein [Streptomyces sp. DE06-01C]